MNRKPLVYVNGEISEMPAGDLVDPAALPAPPAVIDSNLVVLTNDVASARPFGTPVYSKSNGNVADAITTDPDKAEVVGLVADANLPASGSGNIKTGGVLEGTTAQWDAQTGSSGGLAPGSDYYLRSSGGLGTTPVGPNVTKIGKALTSTKFMVRIEPSIAIS